VPKLEADMADLTLDHDMIDAGSARVARSEVRRPSAARLGAWDIVNSQIFIWFLSGVVVAIVSNLWSDWEQASRTRAGDLTRIEMLDLEVMDRLYRISAEISQAETVEDLRKVEIFGVPPAHGIYLEFQNRSLKGLLTELLYLEKKEETPDEVVLSTNDAFRLVLEIEDAKTGMSRPWNTGQETYRKLHDLWRQRARDIVARWPHPETLNQAAKAPPVEPAPERGPASGHAAPAALAAGVAAPL
jgi:hypothetical protein